MPSPTYVAIAKTVLTGTQSIITFSSIPSTYTDLLLKISARTNTASPIFETIFLELNGVATATYSQTMIRGNSSTAASNTNSGQTRWNYLYTSSSGATSNTFSNVEIYFPSYTSSLNKIVSSNSVSENNSSSADQASINSVSHLWSNTNVINQIKLTRSSTGDFIAGSRFDLYGISKS